MKWVLTLLIQFYRYTISPVLGQHCRFEPSCSAYALEAVQTHGAFSGGWLAARRLCRCHPFNPGGYDPVPPVEHGGMGAESRQPAPMSDHGAQAADSGEIPVSTGPAASQPALQPALLPASRPTQLPMPQPGSNI